MAQPLKPLASFCKSLAWKKEGVLFQDDFSRQSLSTWKLQIIDFLKKTGSIVAGAWLAAFASGLLTAESASRTIRLLLNLHSDVKTVNCWMC